MDKEHLRTGDKATCRFRFIKNPEYLRAGTRMVFREGRTKAVGNVTKVYPHIPGPSSHKVRAVERRMVEGRRVFWLRGVTAHVQLVHTCTTVYVAQRCTWCSL